MTQGFTSPCLIVEVTMDKGTIGGPSPTSGQKNGWDSTKDNKGQRTLTAILQITLNNCPLKKFPHKGRIKPGTFWLLGNNVVP